MKHGITWLFGHSGAGKSTLAFELSKRMGAIVLDGNEMRQTISVGAGFSREERRAHNFRVLALATVLTRQMPVIVSVIAPMVETRRAIELMAQRSKIPFKWVYVKRTMPAREGHFIEAPMPGSCITVDCDVLDKWRALAHAMTELGVSDASHSA